MPKLTQEEVIAQLSKKINTLKEALITHCISGGILYEHCTYCKHPVEYTVSMNEHGSEVRITQLIHHAECPFDTYIAL